MLGLSISSADASNSNSQVDWRSIVDNKSLRMLNIVIIVIIQIYSNTNNSLHLFIESIYSLSIETFHLAESHVWFLWMQFDSAAKRRRRKTLYPIDLPYLETWTFKLLKLSSANWVVSFLNLTRPKWIKFMPNRLWSIKNFFFSI